MGSAQGRFVMLEAGHALPWEVDIKLVGCSVKASAHLPEVDRTGESCTRWAIEQSEISLPSSDPVDRS